MNEPDPQIELRTRELVFQQYENEKSRTFELQGQYGRWLISTLVLAHGAAIGFVAQSERLSAKLLPEIGYWSLGGFVLALLCGFSAWANWGYHSNFHPNWDIREIILNGKIPSFNDQINERIRVTHVASLTFGLASAGCLIVSGMCAAIKLSGS